MLGNHWQLPWHHSTQCYYLICARSPLVFFFFMEIPHFLWLISLQQFYLISFLLNNSLKFCILGLTEWRLTSGNSHLVLEGSYFPCLLTAWHRGRFNQVTLAYRGFELILSFAAFLSLAHKTRFNITAVCWSDCDSGIWKDPPGSRNSRLYS